MSKLKAIENVVKANITDTVKVQAIGQILLEPEDRAEYLFKYFTHSPDLQLPD